MISSKVSCLEEKNRRKSIKITLKTTDSYVLLIHLLSSFVASIYVDILGLVQDAGLDEDDYSNSEELNNSKGSARIPQSPKKPSSASHLTV
mmetsp:Transcript_20973/g.52025  ORF Transcript_20973/g.52025 Transcript_20973/m.52025 type:complete len:91 (+) Transcript_20973:315-587(+)